MGAKAVQYTIRSISPGLDRALRKKARERGLSLNAMVLQALEAEAGVTARPRLYDDLDDLIGSWVPDKAVDRALAEQRQVDPGDWT
jgi:hypothetical protein